ncbi:probable DNA-directed RNA polymerases I and III subunit RPAC2 [Sitodiplosis mosellana]|uniref:probable DNA-directed RNA polymerases I and III subunit RPAC2 n=1 Tax=Sitodiplosis mosellana TaxID=263140 RepID=UPI002444EA35|nr:probable DNA-directed RNA polymerases I and III subunit RPAC2 [Sitodiplosis mosellana]
MPSIAVLENVDDNESSCTFVFENEGHTLGNVLKSIICRYPDVNFCGYTVPHPADTKMHLRIQASKNVRAVDVLRRGLADLEKVCDHTITTFESAYNDFQEPK